VNEREYRYLSAQMGLYARAISNEPIVAGKKMRAGKICSSCKCPLPAPHSPGLKRCVFCADKRLVFMYFRQRYGWHCCFRTETREKLPKGFTFRTANTLRERAKRGSCVTDRWDQEGFELGLELGRGGIWLRLTGEQYAALGGVP